MINIALIGLGRIGQLHAANLSMHPRFHLASVYDANATVARQVADTHTTTVVPSLEAIFADAAIDAVLIASPTATHCDLAEQAVQAGKAVLCEKPIHLDSSRAHLCVQALAAAPQTVFQMGFNRRFDPGHAAVIARAANGEIGTIEKVIITSRDSDLPSVDYLRASGGLFHDMMIHDFDIARALLPDEPQRVFAAGSVLADADKCHQANDIDTAMVIMQTASGALCHINCSRRAAYGYDQRIEAFGSNGMLLSNNHTKTQVTLATKDATGVREPLLNFFLDRYTDSFRLQLDAFADAIDGIATAKPGADDGMKALLLADAARASYASGKWQEVEQL